jgi:tetratricopeptide (TPR) repeat protein
MQRPTPTRFRLTAAVVFLLCGGLSLTAQSDQEALFNQAVDAYGQNQFTLALQKFQQVTGSHTAEAQQYIQKMKAYREAVAVAKSEIDRSPDERDTNSLDYAIQRLQQAIQIKPDGPWDANGLLARARELRAQLEKNRYCGDGVRTDRLRS